MKYLKNKLFVLFHVCKYYIYTLYSVKCSQPCSKIHWIQIFLGKTHGSPDSLANLIWPRKSSPLPTPFPARRPGPPILWQGIHPQSATHPDIPKRMTSLRSGFPQLPIFSGCALIPPLSKEVLMMGRKQLLRLANLWNKSLTWIVWGFGEIPLLSCGPSPV